jgi:diguanylate cyclase (GGDEF)-like protein
LQVKDYYTDNIHLVDINLNYSVLDIASMFLDKKPSSFIITDSGKPVYILTQTDLIFLFFKGYENKKLKEIIKKYPKTVFTIYENEDIHQAYKVMRSNNIEHLVVVDSEEKIIGELYSKNLMTKFLEIALIDEMTGLYNKRFLETIKVRYNNSNKKVGVIFIDIDDFKYFNDKFGHDVGDEVIKIVSSYIKSSIREMDFAFRYGGDEFLILVLNQEKDVLLKIAKRIFNKITSFKSDKFGTIGISVGIALYPDDNKDLEKVIKLADQNLYIAKNKGKNRVINN